MASTPAISRVPASAKKNPGGKGKKRQARGGNRKSVKNYDFCQDFMVDFMAKEDVSPLTVARVERLGGCGRMELLTVQGKTVKASLKGNLRCKKGAARSEDNPIAAMVGCFVILQEADYGNLIMGVLSRSNVSNIKSYFPSAPKSYFDMAQTEDAEGFEWDLNDSEEAGAVPAIEVAQQAGRGTMGLLPPTDDVNVDAL